MESMSRGNENNAVKKFIKPSPKKTFTYCKYEGCKKRLSDFELLYSPLGKELCFKHLNQIKNESRKLSM
jgi:hypothetical protein